LTPLAQLIRLCVVNGGLKLRFVNPSAGLLPWISGTRADAVMTGCAKYLTALRYQGEGAQRDPGTLNEILESFPGSFKTYHYSKEVAQNPCIILSGIAKPMSIARRWCNVCHKHIRHMLQTDVQTLYVLLPLAQLIRLHFAMDQTLYLLFTLAELITLHVTDGGQTLVFVTPSRSIDQITCCKWRPNSCICYSTSLSLFDYMLQIVVKTLHLLLTHAQLIRLHGADRGPNLVSVTPSRSIDLITCCKWW